MMTNDAKNYQRIKQRLILLHLCMTFTILSGVIWAGPNAVYDGIARQFHSDWLRVSIYFILFSATFLFFDLPISFYSGYVLEHRFMVSNQTFLGWGIETAKKALLSFFLSLMLVLGLYAILWHFGDRWWLWAWGVYLVFTLIMGRLFPIFIVPLFYQYGSVTNPEVETRLRTMASRFCIPIENIYSLNLSKTTKKANAAFMGLGKSKRIVLSDTLLAHFTPEEIESVLAHEIGHLKHRDHWKQIVISSMGSWAVFFLTHTVFYPLMRELGAPPIEQITSLPVLSLIFFISSLVLAPLQNGISRHMEYAADLFSVKATKSSIFIGCLRKLSEINLADPDPHPLFEWFFYDHPSIRKRIQRMHRQ